MQKLTENVIYQKVKACPTDFSKITQLNITGRELVDVSLIKKLVGLEIISLSVNKISTLVFFQNCKNLRELYLRQNNIKDLREIKHLVPLPKLEVLSLSQNPCAEEKFYRWTVIKNLKHLTEFDHIPVLEEDRREAELLGENLSAAVSLSQINVRTEDPVMQRSASKLNQGLKMSSSTTIPKRKVHSEKFMADIFIGNDHPSKLRLNARRNMRSYYSGYPSRISVESLSGQSFSQCRIFQGSRPDIRATSSQKLTVSEEPAKTYKLFLATVLISKHLCYSELQILSAEVSAVLDKTSSRYHLEQKLLEE